VKGNHAHDAVCLAVRECTHVKVTHNHQLLEIISQLCLCIHTFLLKQGFLFNVISIIYAETCTGTIYYMLRKEMLTLYSVISKINNHLLQL